MDHAIIVLTWRVLRGLAYAPDGSLQDDTGQAWIRQLDWLEPDDAERLIKQGSRFAVQRCLEPPVAGRIERFKRDVKAHMLTRTAAEGYAQTNSVPTVMIGEVWRSRTDGDLLLFVEAPPFPRSDDELQDD